jgi:hypothetical protein
MSMKSMIRTFALRLLAPVVLLAPAAAAQAQGVGHSICRDVWDWGSAKYVRVCDSVYYPPPAPQPPPAPEPPVRHTTGSETTVRYDADAETRKAQSRGGEQRVSPSTSLCPPPYRMTAQDGCQK